MPLVRSSSKMARPKNIATLRREGRPVKQAAAIAYKIQREAVAKKTRKTAPKKKRSRKGGSKLTRRVTSDTVVRMRSSARRRGRRSSSKAIVRHSGSSRARKMVHGAARAASAEKHRTGALIVAAGLGFAKKQGYEIPHVKTVGEAGSIAIGAYAAKKFKLLSSPWLDHLITGAGCIAVYEMASTGEVPFLSAKKKTEGDEVDGNYDVD